jgi:hypothetical protein
LPPKTQLDGEFQCSGCNAGTASVLEKSNFAIARERVEIHFLQDQ